MALRLAAMQHEIRVRFRDIVDVQHFVADLLSTANHSQERGEPLVTQLIDQCDNKITFLLNIRPDPLCSPPKASTDLGSVLSRKA